MPSFGTMLSKAVGVGAVGFALYDGVCCAKAMGKHQATVRTQNWLEDGFYRSRTIDDLSVNQNAARETAFDLETKATDIPATIGRIEGGVKGFFNGLGANLPLILTGSLALLTKGFFCKLGAIGSLGVAAYTFARHGLGIGKPNPME